MENINQQFQHHFSGQIPYFKRPLKGILMVLLAALIFMTLIFLIFATQNEIKKGRYIGQEIERTSSVAVSGQGKVSAKPDIGEVSLSVVSEAPTVAAAQKDNTEKMNKIIAGMKGLGVEEKDLKTTNYTIYPKYQYVYGKSNIIGYEVNQTLEVKIRNLDKVGDILTKATELGTNQMGALSFTFDDPEGLQAEARKKAIDEAKEKAEVLADDLGVKLVRIISFSESTSQPSPPYYYAEKLGVGGGGETPEIQTGQNEIVANVTITYEIQ